MREKTDQKTYNKSLVDKLHISPEFTDRKGLKPEGLNLVAAMPDTPYAFWRASGMHIIANEAAKVGYNVDFAYLPFPNVMEDAEENGLKTLFSHNSVNNADILGVSIANPYLIFNFFKLLELSSITVEREQRKEDEPLVIAGHLGISNPAPFEPFVDAFVIGDGDDVIKEIGETYKANRDKTKPELLEELAKIPGVYVPAFTERTYSEGTLDNIIYRGNPEGVIRQQVIGDLTQYRRADLILKKGKEAFVFIDYSCRYKCAFCQMANIRGKYRANAKEQIKRYLKEFDEIGVQEAVLAGASSTNYPQEDLIEILEWAKQNLHTTKPVIRSVRIDDVGDIAEFLDQDYLHIAPETGTDSLRNKVLMKTITNQEIYENIDDMVGNKGINYVRMYCIVGIPTEIKEDRMEYVKLIHYTAKQIKARIGSGIIRIDMYPLMPQPGTPFEEYGTMGLKRFQEVKDEFEREVRKGLPEGVEFELNGLDPLYHALEGLLNTGDTTAGLMVYEAYKRGANLDALHQVCKEHNLDLDTFIAKGDWNVKPWKPIQFINHRYLERQKQKLEENIRERCSQLANNTT